MSKIPIGQKIKELVNKSGDTVDVFAAKIGMTRGGANRIFKKNSIAVEQLEKICKVLKHDFFADVSKELGLAREPEENFGKSANEELAKIYSLLEKMDKRIDLLELKSRAKKQGTNKTYPPKPRPKKNK